jgi:hypothetical protein
MSTLVIYDGDVAYPVTDDTLNLALNATSISFDLKLKLALATEWQGERLLVACYTDSQTNQEYWYRLARPTLRTAVYHFDGFGFNTALQDLRYTETWSTQRLTNWSNIEPDTLPYGVWRNDVFAISDSQKLALGLVKDTTYNTTGHEQAGWLFSVIGSRSITALRISLEQIFSATIQCDCLVEGWNSNFTTSETVFSGSLPNAGPAGSVLTEGLVHLFTATNIKHITVTLRDTVGTPILYTSETNANMFNVTAIRVVTGGEVVDTTATTGAITAGVPATITPASMDNIVEGSLLWFANTEQVTASNVTATTFDITTVNTYVSGSKTIEGLTTIPNTLIIADIISRLSALNGTGFVNLINSTAGVVASEIDYTDAEYNNADAFTLLGQFATDANVTWGVGPDRRLWFGSAPAPRTWYVLADDIEIAKPLETVINSLQATYTDELGVEQQTTRRTSASAINALGITRQSVLATDVTTLANANAQRNAVLEAFDYRVAQARYSFKHVYTGEGTRVSPLEVKAEDTIIVVNLPVYLAPQTKDRSIVVSDWRYDAFANVITVTPESQLPTLEVLLAAK